MLVAHLELVNVIDLRMRLFGPVEFLALQASLRQDVVAAHVAAEHARLAVDLALDL